MIFYKKRESRKNKPQVYSIFIRFELILRKKRNAANKIQPCLPKERFRRKDPERCWNFSLAYSFTRLQMINSAEMSSTKGSDWVMGT